MKPIEYYQALAAELLELDAYHVALKLMNIESQAYKEGMQSLTAALVKDLETV